MVLQATFAVAGRSHIVSLDEEGITWRPQTHGHGDPVTFFHVPAAEIISCWLCPAGSVKCWSSMEPQGTTASGPCPTEAEVCKSSTRSNGVRKFPSIINGVRSRFPKAIPKKLEGDTVGEFTNDVISTSPDFEDGSMRLPAADSVSVPPLSENVLQDSCSSLDADARSCRSLATDITKLSHTSICVSTDTLDDNTLSSCPSGETDNCGSADKLATLNNFAANLIEREQIKISGENISGRTTSVNLVPILSLENKQPHLTPNPLAILSETVPNSIYAHSDPRQVVEPLDPPPSGQVYQESELPKTVSENVTNSNTSHEAGADLTSSVSIQWRCKHAAKNSQCPGLTLEFCKRVRPFKFSQCVPQESDDDEMITDWRTRIVVFNHLSNELVSTWLHAIQKIIRGLPDRPRHLVVIINPVGGRRRSGALYRRQVAPLLRRAGVSAAVHETTHCGHGQSLALLAAADEAVDGVVAVGGDGLAAEVANGLLLAAARQAGVDPNDPGVVMPETRMRLGIIAGGSTDAYVHSLHGTPSVVTSVLHIIMGSRQNVDIAGLYNGGLLIRYLISGLHLGYLGSLQETGNRLQRMGPVGDVFAFIREMILNRSYSCRVRVRVPTQPSGSPLDDAVCSAYCRVCDRRAGDGYNKEGDSKWLELSGNYSCMTCALVSLQTMYTPKGLAPAAHLGDGHADLLMLPQGSHLNLLKHVSSVALNKHLSTANMQVLRVSEVQLTGLSDTTPLSCDGELCYCGGLVFKVHRRRLSVFCRGKEPIAYVKTLDWFRAASS